MTHVKVLRRHSESGSLSCDSSILIEDGSAKLLTRQEGVAEESMASRVFCVLMLTLLLLCSLLQVLSDPVKYSRCWAVKYITWLKAKILRVWFCLVGVSCRM